jgi:hypothetical protein
MYTCVVNMDWACLVVLEKTLSAISGAYSKQITEILLLIVLHQSKL